MAAERTFVPAQMADIDIAREIPALLPARDLSGRPYRRAISLVRLDRKPLGQVELRLDGGVMDPAAYARRIWEELGPAINARLRRLERPEVSGLAPAGLFTEEGRPAAGTTPAPAGELPFVTVVIATRDRPDTLTKCLESLLALDYPRFDILVVDSAPSSNATAEMIERRFGHLPHLRYVREARPGLAIAHNRGLEEVEAPIVAFTDDDVVVDRRWLAEIVEEFRASDRVGCVTGMILPLELETAAQGWIEQYGGFSKGFERQAFDLSANARRHPLFPYAAGVFGSGANMTFRTSALREVGGFDPALGAGTTARGGDDLAAFFEIVVAGYRLVYLPAAIVRHQHHRSYDGLRRQAHGYGVGLGAYLTKVAIDHPSHIPNLLGKSRYGVYHVLSSSSAKNRGKQHDYPRELTRLEIKGMLEGPFAYLQSRWETRHLRRRQPASTRTRPALADGGEPHGGRLSDTPIPILLYHSVDDRKASPGYSPWMVPTRVFAEHMAHLADAGFQPLTVTQLVQALHGRASLPASSRPVVITFDDGLASFYTGALPILQRHGFGATLYITTGYVGRDSAWLDPVGQGKHRMLTWAEIDEVHASGIECGAHSHTHPQLDILPRSACRAEIERSKSLLEERIGRPVESFAYPYGYYNRSVRQMVQQAGFSSACAVKNAMSSANDDEFALSRIVVTPDVTTDRFAGLLEGGIPTMSERERMRTTVWRLVRRTRQLLGGQRPSAGPA
jgi:peptidoglycan/xylan/chitin deacetylase (PgdA/CDA1 family)/GT2 family glycosyltransferase